MHSLDNGSISQPARQGRWRRRRVSAVGIAVALSAAVCAAPASSDPSSDPLHGGSGAGVTVVGHSDLGGGGLNGEVAVLGNHAYVGMGTNGGFAAQWNKTPNCGTKPSKVKVVNLADAANPTVVSTIDVTGVGEDPGATIARAVSVIEVKPLSPRNTFTGDLLAVALESCAGAGRLGVDLYDVSDPSRPTRVGTDTPVIGTATRDVSLVQRPDGRVLALEANHQSGGIRAVDVTVPAVPVPVGSATATAPGQGCRPFSFAQGVTANAAGSRAYAAYGDGGLFTLDISNPMPGATFPKLGQTLFDPSSEGNGFRYVPNGDETAALGTEEDLLPAETTLSFTGPGGSPVVFDGCEAIWGKPLYRQATTALDRKVVFVPNGGCPADYAGRDVKGKIVLLDRTGSNECFSFDGKARVAQAEGREAAAVVVANTGATQAVFSPDAVQAVDAGVDIPLALISKAAGDALKAGLTANAEMTATLADNPGTWGALRVFDLPTRGGSPIQTAVFNAPRTRTLTPGDGLYHAVNPVWDGNKALVAWMSDGLRVVDLTNRSAPTAGPFYVPPGVVDPTGNYGMVPLVVDVAKLGERVVISDINGGLYVVDLKDPPPATPTGPAVPAGPEALSPSLSPSPFAPGGADPDGCVVSDGFRSVGVQPRGRGASLNFVRSSGVSSPVEIKVYKQSRGRRVVAEQVVARFAGRKRSVRWNGQANRRGKRVTNGSYFVRFRVPTADGADTRRVTLRRSQGRFKVIKPFHRRASCGLLRQFKLGRPVFGGKRRGALKISYLLSERADVSMVVLRGGRTVKRFGGESTAPGSFRRLRLAATGLRRGSYTVRLTASSATRTVTATLTSRRL